MTTVLTIARWEFLTTVRRLSYILTVAGLPVFYLAIGGFVALAGRAAAKVGPTDRQIGVVDHARILDTSLFAHERTDAADTKGLPVLDEDSTRRFYLFEDDARAIDAVRTGRAIAAYAMATDYLASGQITMYTRAGGGLFDFSRRFLERERLATIIRHSLLGARVTEQMAERIVRPEADVVQMHVLPDGGIRPAPTSWSMFSALAGPFGLSFLLSIAIFLSAGFLQQATLEERQNRALELLLSLVSPRELLLGKLIGLSGAGMLQIGIYFALLFIPGVPVLATMQASARDLVLSGVFFMLGYVLFATLMAGTGMLGRSPQESAQLASVWMIGSALPMFLLGSVTGDPRGVLARTLSFVPLTAPIAMLLRLGTGNVPVVDVVLAAASIVMAIYLSVVGATRLFRAGALMYGQRFTLPVLVRAIREAGANAFHDVSSGRLR
ncbi:MAG: ABC transporter permease [Acidobacteria bacterium]|nr:ABC transporter permease [Acidobacteriota bacterium]